MRYQGKVVRWEPTRGFGFVRRHGGDTDVFVHVSAIAGRQAPAIGDVLTWREERDDNGRLRAVEVRAVTTLPAREQPSDPRPASARRPRAAPARKPSSWRSFAALVVLGGAMVAGIAHWKQRSETTEGAATLAGRPVAGKSPLQQPETPRYTCSGKKYCSHMRSCEEAKFYLAHCPGTLSDGDGDGIPCEDQWCGH